jgi:hypothetical protein
MLYFEALCMACHIEGCCTVAARMWGCAAPAWEVAWLVNAAFGVCFHESA